MAERRSFFNRRRININLRNMITLKIDVKKITKSRLYVGEKGTYLNAVLVPTPDSEYSDYMIVESVSMDEKEAGVKGAIIGNAKIVKAKEKQESKPENNPEGAEDLPF